MGCGGGLIRRPSKYPAARGKLQTPKKEDRKTAERKRKEHSIVLASGKKVKAYEVESIQNYRKAGRTHYFTVRWVGYPKPGYEDTEEPLANLFNSAELIGEYLRRRNIGLRVIQSRNGALRLIQVPVMRKQLSTRAPRKRQATPKISSVEEASNIGSKATIAKHQARESTLTASESDTEAGPSTSQATPENTKAERRTTASRSKTRMGRREEGPARNQLHKEKKGSAQRSGQGEVAEGSNTTASTMEANPEPSSIGQKRKADDVAVHKGYEIRDPAETGRAGGVELGWTPEEILCIVKPTGRKKRKGSSHSSKEYLVKWQEKNIVEPVPGDDLIRLAPQLLVRFLEDRIRE